MHRFELLAPAGNFDCLITAVQSGADAVYLSGEKFGARSFADNFDEEHLEKAIDYCHLRGVKVYVTVNTLIADSETEELKDYLLFLSKIGTDAIIVQDMGVVRLALEIVPELPIHASTQMTIHNKAGVSALKKFNVKRVVLSRELSLGEINDISKSCDMELEVFVHGALCMCYSGQCLFSSIIGGRSGNRGKCAQPCRLPYSINEKKDKKFFLSLKDLSAIEHLEELAKANVLSLKIEGRMKGPAYVAAVVGIYRKYIDNLQKISQQDIDILNSVFNRGGLTDGYLTKKPGVDMFALNKPDNPYLKGSLELEKGLLSNIKNEQRKNKLFGHLKIKRDSLPVMNLLCGDISVEYRHDKLPDDAIKLALDKEGVTSQIKKTGGTPFEFEELCVEIDNGLFLSAGELNKIRRNALELLERAIINSFKRISEHMTCKSEDSQATTGHIKYVCEVTNVKQLKAVLKFEFDLIYVPLHLVEENSDILNQHKSKIVIVSPDVLRGNEFDAFVQKTKQLLQNGYHGVAVQNIALIKPFEGYNIYGGFRLNVFNGISQKVYGDMGLNALELSPELTLKQIKEMKKFIPVQVMVYGRLPIVVSENCLIRNGGSCPCDGSNYITDRIGMKFPVIKDGNICRSVILNCKKTFLAPEGDKIKNVGIDYFRLYFTDETPDECEKICKVFLFGDNYKSDDFTNGHFYKGVMN